MDDSQSLTPLLDGSIISCYSIALAAVILRIHSRRSLGSAGLWWDDWLAVAAIVPATAAFVLYMADLRQYLGHHIYSLGLDAFTPFLKDFFIVEFMYIGILTLVKASILCFYWRLFAISAKKHIIAMAVLLGLWSLASFFALTFQCTPVDFNWNRLTEEGQCVNIQTLFLGISAPNIVTDFLLAALPFPYILRLKLRLGQKLMLAGIFAIGLLVVAVSIVRIVSFMQQNFNDPDITYNLTNIMIYSVVEVMAAITCACLPALRPIISMVRNVFLRTMGLSSTWSSWNASSKNSKLRSTTSAHSGRSNSGNRLSNHKMLRLSAKPIELEPSSVHSPLNSPPSSHIGPGTFRISRFPGTTRLHRRSRSDIEDFADQHVQLTSEDQGEIIAKDGVTVAVHTDLWNSLGATNIATAEGSPGVSAGARYPPRNSSLLRMNYKDGNDELLRNRTRRNSRDESQGREDVINVRSSWTIAYHNESQPEDIEMDDPTHAHTPLPYLSASSPRILSSPSSPPKVSLPSPPDSPPARTLPCRPPTPPPSEKKKRRAN